MSHPKHILVVCCLVRNEHQQLWLVRHRQRGWELPQGRVEEGEALIPALHREVKEETGVAIDAPQLAIVWSKLSAPAAVIIGFLAGHRTGRPTPSEETPEVAWFSAAEAVARVDHPVNADRLHALLTHGGPVALRSYTTGPYRQLD